MRYLALGVREAGAPAAVSLGPQDAIQTGQWDRISTTPSGRPLTSWMSV
jgi:hypothetical protein